VCLAINSWAIAHRHSLLQVIMACMAFFQLLNRFDSQGLAERHNL
jgi:hypothetical protein